VELFTVDSDGELEKVSKVKMSWATDVVLDSGYAYVSDAKSGLVVLDVSNPSSPSEVASEWTLGGGWNLAKQGDRVYLASGLFGVQVIDVSDPENPTWVENILLCDVVTDVSVGRNLLVTTGWIDGLAIVGLGQEGSEVVSTFKPESCLVRDTYLAGSQLNVLLPYGRVQQVSLSNPREPWSVDTYEDAGRSVSARLGSGYMLIAERYLFGGRVTSYLVTAVEEP
jgi:hypothetical protein